MIRRATLAFITGLQFSVLQFCFLAILQINVSSAYLTYMTVAFAWMVGSVIGMWVKRLTSWMGVVLGTLAFYFVHILLTFFPFSYLALIVSAVGISVAAIWAGRFFVVMRSRFESPDKMFFHENNGFLLGIILFFVGFTTLGSSFIIFAPGVGGISLLYLNRLEFQENSL